MEYYAGIDVSLESASLCVVDATGRIVREAKVASEPETLIEWFRGLGITATRIGLEAGPLSQWLYAGMRDAGLAVELLETRHVQDAFNGNAGQDRSEGRAWHCPADAAGLVSSGALQVAAGAGSASAADSTQATADEEPRRRDESARGAARFWIKGRANDTENFPWPDPRTSRQPYHAVNSD
jgi:hypothetical protein